MKGVQCYELFGGIAPKNHTFNILRHPSEAEDSMAPIVPADNIVVSADQDKIARSLR